MINSSHWQQCIGNQRDWVWRGWQTRYTYIRPLSGQNPKSSTPLILLHGFGTSIGHWQYNLAELGQYHTVYALDMIGFGASEKVFTTYKVELWVEQVYDFWRTFVQQPAVLIGNSLGSLVSLAAAAIHPEMAQGLVLLSLPVARQEALPAWLQPLVGTLEGILAPPLLLGLLFRLLVRRPQVIRRLAQFAYTRPEAVTEELVAMLVTPPQDRGAAQAFCQLCRARTQADFSPSATVLLRELQLPTLLIWGQQDRIIPIALGRQFGQLNPKLQLMEFEAAGHFLHDEFPEQVNQEILNWINSECQNPIQPTSATGSSWDESTSVVPTVG